MDMLDKLSAYISRFLSFAPQDTNEMPARRVDLDWLRVGLFGLLIVHHIGMFYVANWGWHAKSQYRSEWLESLLLIVEPWRMPAIWLVSGIAIRFVLAKVSLWRYVSLRSLRLLLPLLFGVLIIVPPQLFVEMSAKGEIDVTYWQFLNAFFQSDHPMFKDYTWGIWPHIDVNHLWYLRSLWYYSMSLIFLLPILNSQFMMKLVDWLVDRHGSVIVLSLVLPVFLIEFFWEFSSSRYPIGFYCLVLGYLLGWHSRAWEKIGAHLTLLGLAYLAVLVLLLTGYNLFWIDKIQGADVGLEIELFVEGVYSVARILGLLTVLALATRFLNQRSRLLRYCNDAVYPFYILHQSVILVAGYYLTQLNLGPAVEACLLVLATLLGCLVIFEGVRRVDILRPLFGLKMQGDYAPLVRQMGYLAAVCMVTPLAYQLLF